MLNRTIAPDFQSIKKLSIHQPELLSYPNGLKSFIFQDKDLELIKFEFVFENVFDKDELPLLNTALASMFKEGTEQRSTAQIADEVDFYGAYLMPEYTFDYTSLTLYTMHKYVNKVLPIVLDIFQNSIFPQKELNTYVRNNKQSLGISLKKNDFVARRLFYQNLFGYNQYGFVPTLEAFDSVKREALLNLFQKQIRPNNCTLFIAGHVTSEVIQIVEELFGKSWQTNLTNTQENLRTVLATNFAGIITEDRPDALQSAIRFGQVTINRSHSDFPALQFVNTLFGGFFGSRLMRNIREDKGYTYSIGSAVVSLKNTGFWTIASEVGADVTKNTISEIEKEFTILHHDLAAEDEISLVRNYMQGVMLGSLESIFSHVDKFKAVYFSGLTLDYYNYYSDVIQSMDASRVRSIAQQYLDYDKLTKVVVGKIV